MGFDVGLTHRKTPHLVSDLVELVLLTRFDNVDQLAKASLADFIGRENLHPEELDAKDPDLGDAEKNDLASVWVEDVWKHLKYRDNAFGSNYPFDVDGNVIKLHPKQTNGMRIYSLLLACSRLRSFPEKYRVLWAKYFTMLCAHAMRAIVRDDMIVRIFDANSDDRVNYYGTNLKSALVKLGEDLHLHHIHKHECELQESSGDYGIDLVAHYPMGDTAAGTLVILGQCGAREKEWPSKRFEGHPLSLRAAYSFIVDPYHSLFMPMCFRESTGVWSNNSKVSGCLMFDRSRIINLVLKRPDFNEILISDWFVNFEKSFQESLVV